jgi:hypothetical protein
VAVHASIWHNYMPRDGTIDRSSTSPIDGVTRARGRTRYGEAEFMVEAHGAPRRAGLPPAGPGEAIEA